MVLPKSVVALPKSAVALPKRVVALPKSVVTIPTPYTNCDLKIGSWHYLGGMVRLLSTRKSWHFLSIFCPEEFGSGSEKLGLVSEELYTGSD